jgi:ribosomal protein S18 acetylase RimI-like enzyme
VTTVEVTTTYLEIRRGELRPAAPPRAAVDIKPVTVPVPAFSRFLYTTVGAPYHWVDRLPWTDAQWLEWLDRPELETWVAYRAGTPLGYVELELQAQRSTEIAYFGLLPQFTGQGIGGHLLTHAVERGFALGAERVWVHTCDLDSPAALPGYLARGFTVYDRRTHPQVLPPG